MDDSLKKRKRELIIKGDCWEELVIDTATCYLGDWWMGNVINREHERRALMAMRRYILSVTCWGWEVLRDSWVIVMLENKAQVYTKGQTHFPSAGCSQGIKWHSSDCKHRRLAREDETLAKKIKVKRKWETEESTGSPKPYW